MNYYFQTNLGLFTIKSLEDGRFGLYENTNLLGSYHSAESAADDVYMCATGWNEWDEQESVDEPESLSEWMPNQLSSPI